MLRDPPTISTTTSFGKPGAFGSPHIGETFSGLSRPRADRHAALTASAPLFVTVSQENGCSMRSLIAIPMGTAFSRGIVSHVRPSKNSRITLFSGCLTRTFRKKLRRRSSLVRCIVCRLIVVMIVMKARIAAELPIGFNCWKSAAKKTVGRCGNSLKPLCRRTATASSICEA